MSAAVLERVARPVIVADSCDICFGRGKIFGKPGELIDCPNGCPGFAGIHPTFGELIPGPVLVVMDPVVPCRCGCSLSDCIPDGCGHSCCC